MKRALLLGLVFLAAVLLLAGCRNETQNRIRRSIQDFTGQRMYITIYSYDGKTIFQGIVDGKITRSLVDSSNGESQALGHYVFWYDDRGRYHQTDLPYMLTNYAPNTE